MAKDKKKKGPSTKKAPKIKKPSPQQQAEAETRLQEYAQQRKQEQEAAASFLTELTALRAKYADLAMQDTSLVVANLLIALDPERGVMDYELGHWGIENAMDWYMGLKVKQHIPRIAALYEFLKDKGYTEDNQWEYTIDGYAFYIPCNEEVVGKVFQIGRRSANYLFYLYETSKLDLTEPDLKLKNSTALHVRQVFDSSSEHYARKNLDKELRQGGLNRALTCFETLEELSDNVENYQFVRKPDLAWHKSRGMKLEYGDCRDGGYILSTDRFSDKLDNCLGYYHKMKSAFFWLNLGVSEMEDPQYAD